MFDVVQGCKEGRFDLPKEGASQVGSATRNLKPNSSPGMSLLQSYLLGLHRRLFWSKSHWPVNW